MSTEEKVYMNYGYKIVRKYHYVDAHQHYDYIVNMEGKERKFTSLAAAKRYISDVLQWVTGKKQQCNRTPLKGLPEYSIDVERQEVFGRRGIPLKGEKRSNQIIYKLEKDKVKHSISFSRLAYAALHGINPLKIPTDIVVVESNGEYILQNICDFQYDNNQRRQRDRQRMINDILNKRRLEIDILQRYYQTHDTTEIVTYITKDIFESMVLKVLYKNHCGMQRATDIVTDAQERFLQRVINGNLPTISISPTIQALCKQCTAETMRKQEYNDNVIY